MAFKKLHGVHVPHRKNTAGAATVTMDPPSVVTIPVSMHIGAPAKPLVKAGDLVTVGQRIAEVGGFVSSPVHASVSGKVKKIDEMLNSQGRKVPVIVIESDGQMTRCPDLKPPVINSAEDFLQALTDSGIVGLGGAGFPTSVKLRVKDLSKIEAVIVNGAECEPYITSDTRTMVENPKLVVAGAKMLQQYIGVKRVIFAIEDNKPECISALESLCQGEDGLEVASLPSLYPRAVKRSLFTTPSARSFPRASCRWTPAPSSSTAPLLLPLPATSSTACP